MKKLLLVLLFLGLAKCAQGEEVAGSTDSVKSPPKLATEHSWGASIGTGVTEVSLYRSGIKSEQSTIDWELSYLWRKKKRLVWGLAGGSSSFQSAQPEASGRASDIAFLVGYWSNRMKKSTFGWHIHTGLGLSFFDLESKTVNSNSNDLVSISGRFGVGLDYYFSKSERKTWALTTEWALVDRVKGVIVSSRPDNLHVANSVVRLGVRIWY